MILPTLRQLQYLRALARAPGFKAAAEACNVTQPSLSAGIAELETLLGEPLLDRRQRKKILLTPFGQTVLAHAQNILAGAENLMAAAQAQKDPMAGIFRLGLIPTVAPYLLPRILKPLEKKFPQTEFQIFESVSQDLVHKIDNGDIDAALMAFPYSHPDSMTHRILLNEPFWCAAPARCFPGKKKISIDDLAGQKLLLLEDGHCLRDHALSACRLQQSRDKKTFSAASLPTLIQMVAQGYGITLLPDMVARHGTPAKGLRLIPFADPAPARQIGFLWRRHAPRAAGINSLLRHLEGAIKP